MELDELRTKLRHELDEVDHPNRIEVDQDDLISLLDHVDAAVEASGRIERRAQQVRGGLKPYARPSEVVDFLLGTTEEA